MARAAITAMLVGLLAGCASWHGPAEIQFHGGYVKSCPSGLAFDSIAITCRGGDQSGRYRSSDSRYSWGGVSGFSTR